VEEEEEAHIKFGGATMALDEAGGLPPPLRDERGVSECPRSEPFQFPNIMWTAERVDFSRARVLCAIVERVPRDPP